MKARDVMVFPVITVSEGASVREVAKTLLDKRISAVPVVGHNGKLVGIVTESDLMHRVEAGTERRRSWWLEAFADDRVLAADYVRSHAAKIRDIMTRKVITATPETQLCEIAQLLEKHQIKRVPIVSEDGDLVGIVSRANLIQAVASAQPKLEVNLSDTTIRHRLLDSVAKQPWAHTYNFNATVTNGIVELWGVVDSEEERKALSIAAEAIPGVTAVDDHLINQPAYVY